MDARQSPDNSNTAITAPRITLPDFTPPTPEELEQRRASVKRILELREKIGPIGIDPVELIDADFYEIDAVSE